MKRMKPQRIKERLEQETEHNTGKAIKMSAYNQYFSFIQTLATDFYCFVNQLLSTLLNSVSTTLANFTRRLCQETNLANLSVTVAAFTYVLVILVNKAESLPFVTTLTFLVALTFIATLAIITFASIRIVQSTIFFKARIQLSGSQLPKVQFLLDTQEDFNWPEPIRVYTLPEPLQTPPQTNQDLWE